MLCLLLCRLDFWPISLPFFLKIFFNISCKSSLQLCDIALWLGIEQEHLVFRDICWSIYEWNKITSEIFFYKNFIYLSLERWEGKEKESKRNIDASTAYLVHVPETLGVKLMTLWFTGQHSVHRAPPARVTFSYNKPEW